MSEVMTNCQCSACVMGTIHASDCAVHNMPYMDNGPCDCAPKVSLTADDIHWFEDAFRAWDAGDMEGVLDGLNAAVNAVTPSQPQPVAQVEAFDWLAFIATVKNRASCANLALTENVRMIDDPILGRVPGWNADQSGRTQAVGATVDGVTLVLQKIAERIEHYKRVGRTGDHYTDGRRHEAKFILDLCKASIAATPTIPTGHRIVPEVPQDLSTSTDGFGINRPVNAMLADALRHLAKPGQKVIWRGSFRWFDDDGVLSNHYDGMDIDQLASEFDYDVHYNAHHAALVSKLNAAPNGGG